MGRRDWVELALIMAGTLLVIRLVTVCARMLASVVAWALVTVQG